MSPDGTAADRFAAVLQLIANHPNPAPFADVAAAIESRPTAAGGTMREWMTAHTGAHVGTLQLDGYGRVWTPGPRPIDTARSTYVELGGSRRDYAGCRVLAADGTALVIESSNGPDTPPTVILYWVTANPSH